MIFKKRRAHPLPKFPPTVIPAFKRLCEALDVSVLPQLKDEVLKVFTEMRASFDFKDDSELDVNLFDQLENRCFMLLDNYEQASKSERAMIVGVLRYCSSEIDVVDDHVFATGLLDDIKIVNYVLEEIGLAEMAIKI